MNKKFPQGGFSNTNTFGSSSFGMNSNNQGIYIYTYLLRVVILEIN